MSRATTDRKQWRGAVTRERLLEATVETLVERGYAQTSMPELCKRAGLSRGAQLHHFPTKAELLAAAVERVMDRRQTELEEALAGLPSRQRAQAFIDELWRIYSGPTFHAWLELAVASRTDPELRAHLAEVNRRFYERAIDTLRELVPAASDRRRLLVVARFVTSMMDGVGVNRILDDDDRLSVATLDLFKRTLGVVLADGAKEVHP